MKGLLVFRERLQTIYAASSVYINKAFQLVLALVIFWSISNTLGYFTALAGPLVVVGASVVCMFLPLNFTVFVSIALVLAHAYKQSLEAFAVSAVIILILFAVYYRLVPKHAIIVLLVPIAFALKIPYVVPLALGLACSPISALSAGCGVVGYYLVTSISTYASMSSSSGEEADMMTGITTFIRLLLENKEMYLMIIGFCIIIFVVYAIRRSSVYYSWAIAIIVGLILSFVIFIGGSMMMEVEINYFMLVIGNILSLGIALILEWLLFTVDYSGTKKVQYEDDEYYYYVKAVPKMRVDLPRRSVKKISPQNTQGEYEENLNVQAQQRRNVEQRFKSENQTTESKPVYENHDAGFEEYEDDDIQYLD